MTEPALCSCGRALLAYDRELEATCSACRSLPDFCPCGVVTPPTRRLPTTPPDMAPLPAENPAETGGASRQPAANLDEWEDPVSLAGHAAPLPPFPVNALPEWIAKMVYAVARFFDTPPDVAAFAALGAVSVGTARRAWVNAKGQREPVNAYLLTALDSGARKSGPFKLMAFEPLKTARNFLQDEAEAAPLPPGYDQTPVIRLISTSGSPAALRDLATANGERIGVVSDEGGIFQELAGRYDRVPDLDLVLSGWNASPYMADRATKFVPPMDEPVLTLCLTVQPHVLRTMAANEAFVARGLLARILYGLPPDVVGHRQNDRIAVPRKVSDCYAEKMRDLLISFHAGSRHEWSLSDAAYKIFHDAEQALEPKMARGALYGGNDGMREWASKYMGQILRIAGLLHAAENVTGNAPNRISEQAMRNALMLGEYFLAHAEATFGFMRADPHAEGAGEILRWLAGVNWDAEPFSRRSPRSVTKREVCKWVRRYRNDPDGAQWALRLLEKHGWVSVTQGARQSWTCVPHPKLSALVGTTKNSGVSPAQDRRGSADMAVGRLSAGVGGSVVVPTTADKVPTPLSAVPNPSSPADTYENPRSADNRRQLRDQGSEDTPPDTDSDSDPWVRDAPGDLDHDRADAPGGWPDGSGGAAANPHQTHRPTPLDIPPKRGA